MVGAASGPGGEDGGVERETDRGSDGAGTERGGEGRRCHVLHTYPLLNDDTRSPHPVEPATTCPQDHWNDNVFQSLTASHPRYLYLDLYKRRAKNSSLFPPRLPCHHVLPTNNPTAANFRPRSHRIGWARAKKKQKNKQCSCNSLRVGDGSGSGDSCSKRSKKKRKTGKKNKKHNQNPPQKKPM